LYGGDKNLIDEDMEMEIERATRFGQFEEELSFLGPERHY